MIAIHKFIILLAASTSLLACDLPGLHSETDSPSAATTPRQYCRTNGGSVIETSNPAEYLCCDRQGCLLTNTHTKTSHAPCLQQYASAMRYASRLENE